MTDSLDMPKRSGTRGPDRAGKANLADVARLAGVSRATASRVLAGRAGGKAASHARVLAAAEQLGYVVNGLARSMMGVGRGSIAFVSAAMVGPTFAAMAAGAEEVATANDHLFLMCTTGGDPARERELIDSLGEQRADAVLLVGSSPTDDVFEERAAAYAEMLSRVGARLILCGRPALLNLPHIASVDYDHAGGVTAGVQHLAGLGHLRIAYVGENEPATTAQERYRGYREGVASAGLEFDDDLVVPTDNDPDHAAAALREFRRTHTGVTGYVCQTDLIAIGVCRALREDGIAVPGEVSVVGFDDTPLVADLTPSLSTVHAPFREVGLRAGAIAVGAEYDGPIILPSRLIVRQSSGPAPDQAD